MRNTQNARRIAAFILLLCLGLFASTGVYAETVEEIEARQAELQKETDTLTAELETLKGDEAKAQEYKATLGASITLAQERIDTAETDIADLNTNILALEAKLKESETKYADSIALLKKRITAIYQTGDVGTVEILLDASSLYDFSLKTEMLKSFTEHDKALLKEINTFIEGTTADRDALNNQKQAVAELKKQQEADRARLNMLMEDNNQLIKALQAKQAEKQSTLNTLEEEDEALNAKLVELMGVARRGDGSIQTSTPIGGDGSPMSADFIPRWPLPGYDTGWITCWYGDGGHNGLDVAGNYGAPIVAAQSGRVISAEYHYSWGNNVLIYHNSTYSTRYAHMSSMAVSTGQTVERGQTIGYVGSTGDSTGNHLHFEVYENDSRVDPYPFL